MTPDTTKKAPRRSKHPISIIVQADRLDDEGAGLAGGAGPEGTIHVAGLLPGEEAEIQIVHRSPHTGQGWAVIRRRRSAAPERVVPVCPGYGYGRCGGCLLQHLCYPAQLAWKHERLLAALAPLGVSGDLVPAPVPSPELHYRGRAKLVAAPRPGGGVLLGAYAPRSHQVIDMAGCRLVSPLLDGIAGTVAAAASRLSLAPYDETHRSGCLRYVLLRDSAASPEGSAQVSLVCAEPPSEAAIAGLVAALSERPEVRSLVLHENRQPGDVLLPAAAPAVPDRLLLGEGWIWDRVGTVELRVSARSFLQINRVVAGRIYEDVAAALVPPAMNVQPGDQVLDLYCGVGGIGLSVLSRHPDLRLLGIEENPVAVADAQASAERAGLAARARFLAGDADAALAEVAGPVALAVINPPRRGCSKGVLERLGALRPRALAYVSCDPQSLARDLAVLVAQGYYVRRVTPYDMHPHTPHIEALALLLQGPAQEGFPW